MEWSFIDFGNRDFLRNDNDEVIVIEGNHGDAEDWLLSEGEDNGWTNKGVRYWCWDEEE